MLSVYLQRAPFAFAFFKGSRGPAVGVIAAVLFFFCAPQKGVDMKAKEKHIFTRYRWIICFILLILACLTLRHIIVWYKTRPPNHIHIYDLTWPDRTDANNIVYRRWRYYLEPGSYRPLKVEKYSRDDPNDSFTLEETLVISYPTEDEIRQVIKDAGFQLYR